MANKKKQPRSRKRKFYGNRHSSTASPESQNTSASERKLSCTDYCDSQTALNTNRIINLEILMHVFSLLLCPKCLNKTLYMEEEARFGLASHLCLKCNGCDFVHSFFTSKKTNKLHIINSCFVFGLRIIGKGFSSAEKLCSSLNMPCLSSRSFRYHVKKLLVSATSISSSIMKEAALEIRKLKNCTTEAADCGVSVDGSWQKRGFSSLNGAVTAVSIDTGKIIDIEIMSKQCRKCKHIKGSSSNHICSANYDGSAGGMESIGSYRIFERSESTRNLRYVDFYGDGDSKGYETVKNIYGNNSVTKQECIGHVQKRVGCRLRKLKAKYKGIGGKGKLTDKFIDKLQNYYGIAIRSNVSDLENMQKAVIAAFFHCCSGKNQLMHGQCPEGEDSWCKFQRAAIQNNILVDKSPGLPKKIINIIKPVYMELCDQKLLKKCLHGLTQNTNECFNGRLWELIPKNNFVELSTFSLGANIAVIQFNKGYTGLLAVLEAHGIVPGYFTVNGFQNHDNTRITHSKRHSLPSVKLRRKKLRAQRKSKFVKIQNEEEPMYKAGEF